MNISTGAPSFFSIFKTIPHPVRHHIVGLPETGVWCQINTHRKRCCSEIGFQQIRATYCNLVGTAGFQIYILYVIKEWMMCFCRLEVGIALVPSAKSITDCFFLIRFTIVTKDKLSGKHKYIIHFKFSRVIFTDEHHFNDFWSVNEIARSRKLTLCYKHTPQQSHDFIINTTKYLTTP